MSVNALAGFLGGFADTRNAIKDRKEREANAARMDSFIANMGSYPTAGAVDSGGMGLPGRGGMGRPGQPNAAPGSGLFGLIDATEGGGNYSTLYGHSQNGGAFDGVDVSNMTLAELYDFSAPTGPYGQWSKSQLGYVATPMGRHQIVGATLRSAADGMGLSPDTKFTPQTQDAMAAYLARNRLAGATSPAGKRAALRAEWEGFRGVPDSQLDAAIADFEANGGVLLPRAAGLQPR